jgi:hypothetical protein
VFDRNLRRVLRGQPSLRRQLENVDEGRLLQAIPGLADRDAWRWKGLYRRDLQNLAEAEQIAAPLRRREALQELERRARQSGNVQLANRLGDEIRTNTPRWGSIEQQQDPRRWGSAASRMFRGLYRG